MHRGMDRSTLLYTQRWRVSAHRNTSARRAAREDIGTGLRLSALPAGEIADRVDRAANIVGLRHQLDRTPVHLSGGRRQLVAMGRAIVRQPAVFLFDEPLSNTDEKLRDAVPSEIAALHKRAGTTVIYMTHEQVDASKVASLTIAIDRGAARHVGCPRDVHARPGCWSQTSPAHRRRAARRRRAPSTSSSPTFDGARPSEPGFQLPLPDRFRIARPRIALSPSGIRPEHMSRTCARPSHHSRSGGRHRLRQRRRASCARERHDRRHPRAQDHPVLSLGSPSTGTISVRLQRRHLSSTPPGT